MSRVSWNASENSKFKRRVKFWGNIVADPVVTKQPAKHEAAIEEQQKCFENDFLKVASGFTKDQWKRTTYFQVTEYLISEPGDVDIMKLGGELQNIWCATLTTPHLGGLLITVPTPGIQLQQNSSFSGSQTSRGPFERYGQRLWQAFGGLGGALRQKSPLIGVQVILLGLVLAWIGAGALVTLNPGRWGNSAGWIPWVTDGAHEVLWRGILGTVTWFIRTS